MYDDDKKVPQAMGDNVESCECCGRELPPGEPRYRTSDGTFCPECYKKAVGPQDK